MNNYLFVCFLNIILFYKEVGAYKMETDDVYLKGFREH